MITVALGLFGLAAGSFVNALVWRLWQQSLPKKKRVASTKELLIVSGRSMCPHCQHRLEFIDLIPIFSWLALKGKCRYCHKSISWQYPLVELLTATLFVVSYLLWPYGFEAEGIFRFAIWLATIVPLMALLVYDLRWMLLPDRLTFVILGLSFVQLAGLVIVFGGGVAALFEASYGFLVLGGLFYLLFQLSGGRWIGGGDVKLGFGLGILVGGPLASLALLFTASLIGTLVALPLLLSGKTTTKSPLAFGPLLITATFIIQLSAPLLSAWFGQYYLFF